MSSFQFICKILAALQKSAPVAGPWFRFLIRGAFWQRRRRGRRQILIECSPPDNEFSSPFKCVCRMLEWFITADSEVWQWAPEMSDGILFLISFPWSPLIPWPCVPLLIRNQGFPLINRWVSCSALSQISCLHYLSYRAMAGLGKHFSSASALASGQGGFGDS